MIFRGDILIFMFFLSHDPSRPVQAVFKLKCRLELIFSSLERTELDPLVASEGVHQEEQEKENRGNTFDCFILNNAGPL